MPPIPWSRGLEIAGSQCIVCAAARLLREVAKGVPLGEVRR
jgi:hypothetical protein